MMRKIAKILAMFLFAGASFAASTAPAPIATASSAEPSGADAPASDLLQEYERRLFPAPACLTAGGAGGCAQIQKMNIQASGGAISISMEVHALARSSIQLPSLGGGQWVASPDLRFSRAQDGTIGVLVEPGINRVVLGVAPQGDEVVVGFASPPKVVEKSLSGWNVELAEAGALTSLKLTRGKAAESSSAEPQAADAAKFDAPLFMDITRTLSFDANGAQEQITVTRLTPADKPATGSLSLMTGEKVVTEGAATADDKSAKVDFAAGEQMVVLTAKWDYAAQFELVAAAGGDRRETWIIQPWSKAPMKFEGASPAAADGNATSLLFLPRPGEKLTMKPQAIVPAKGAQIAVDKSELAQTPGSDRVERIWTIVARSTIGAPLVLSVPKEWLLESSSRNGQASPPSRKDGKYVVDLLPGQNNLSLMFRQDQAKGALQSSPAVELSAPAANLTWTLAVPNDEWVIWTWGPVLGPAVLIWGVFAAMAALGWVLSKKLRATFAPSFIGWLAILVPLSALSPWSALFLVGFVFALAAKERAHGVYEIKNWNLVQFILMAMGVVSGMILMSGVYEGLLGVPDMMVEGNGSNASHLAWYADKAMASGASFANFEAGAILAPIWLWRAAMLAWALWIAAAVIKRIPAMWSALCLGGLWRRKSPMASSGPSEDPAAPLANVEDREEINEEAPAGKSL